MENVKEIIAKDLLKIKAVFLRPEQPFTWASGIQSPVYCDNRLILTAPLQRVAVEKAIAETCPVCEEVFNHRFTHFPVYGLTQEQLDYMADAILSSVDEMQRGV